MKWVSQRFRFRWAALAVIVWVLAACAPAAGPRAAAPAAPASEAAQATAQPTGRASGRATAVEPTSVGNAAGSAAATESPKPSEAPQAEAKPTEASKAEEAKPPETTEPTLDLAFATQTAQAPDATQRTQEATATTEVATMEAPAAAAPAPAETATPEATLTPVPPSSDTPPPPTSPPAPTNTPVPPTLTPTLTPLPPTALPPTATSLAPSDTPVIPTATAVPATAAPTNSPIAPTPTAVIETETPAKPAAKVPTATEALSATLAMTTTQQAVQVETRIAELEWPPEMRLGGSESIRLALIPSTDSYTVTVENAQNQVVTQTVPVKPRPGYDLFAIAKLNAPQFEVHSDFPEQQALIAKEPLRWRWLISPREGGRQMASVLLYLHWEPQAGNSAKAIDGAALIDRAMQIEVTSVLGMSTAQAANMGGMGLLASLALSGFALLFRRAPAIKTTLARVVNPNARLKIEPNPGIVLAEDETALLQTLFRRYARLVVQSEFRSGYSGARTLLALPVREDGRADAYTIAKIGDREAIQQEYDNYERYVKDTLPPVTARIQELPVTAPALVNRADKAVLRYTFIGEPGKMPTSLREALLREGDPDLLNKLFDMFGPNWWMQRRPHTFRLAAEYDTILPAHYVIEPIEGPIPRGAKGLDGRMPPTQEMAGVGDIVFLKNFPLVQKRADGRSLSLTGEGFGGNPPLRVRWMGETLNSASAGRVTATRLTLLRELIGGADLCGLPDPLPKLQGFLNENVIGSHSTIHGDLNLENVLVGPGGFVWLIDFAQTREGHPLADFAHLEAEIVAHVLAPHMTAAEFVAMLRDDGSALLKRLHQIVQGCLLNPSQPREYWLALAVTCLGAMKYANLGPHQRHLLYLCAAYWAERAK